MENLVEKINDHTASGPPSVSELIELQELARKLKVPRATLEKMITEAVASRPEKESSISNNQSSTIEPSYERPDYDAARNSFDTEMNQRREAESIPEREEIEFNRPDIVFPTMEDPFAKKDEGVEPEIIEEGSVGQVIDAETSIEDVTNLHFDAYRDSLFEDEKSIDSSVDIEMQIQENEVEKQETEFEEFERLKAEAKAKYRNDYEEESQILNKEGELKDQERIENEIDPIQQIEPLDEVLDNVGTSEGNLIDLIESIKESKGSTIEFEEAVEELDNVVNSIAEETEQYVQKESQFYEVTGEVENLENFTRKEEINDWVANANKEERNRAEELAKRSLEANPSNENRSFERDDDTYGMPSKLENARSAYTLGIVAIIVSVLFGVVGGIVGIFGIGKASEGLRKIKLSPKSYEPGALSKFKNARTLSVIAIVISGFKLFRMFYFGYYFF